MALPFRKDLAAGAALVVCCWTLALASALLARRSGVPLCAQDSVPLKPEYQVDVALQDGRTVSLCNVTCALLYLKEAGRRAARVIVRDETTGAPLDPASAFFVESDVFTHRESSNRVHVFASRADAQEHAREYGGRFVPDPFPPPR